MIKNRPATPGDMRIFKGGGKQGPLGKLLTGGGLKDSGPADFALQKGSAGYNKRHQEVNDSKRLTKAYMVRDKADPVKMAEHQNTMGQYSRTRKRIGSGNAFGGYNTKNSLLG